MLLVILSYELYNNTMINTKNILNPRLAAAILVAAMLPAAMLTYTPVREAQATTGFTDFNGDGYEDLAIGVMFEDVDTIENAGAVNVIYGSSGGLSPVTVGGTGRADQIWTQDSTGIEDMAETNDFFGNSLAAGDFNNDGYSDLAIGAVLESVMNEGQNEDMVNAGAVNVIYGSS
ncbi:MAG TPA: FG-GAP repeat protein, partial [Nitrososphaera sp.]|nr:FG-GAP repeat protein [Nitrososphaera sp.]